MKNILLFLMIMLGFGFLACEKDDEVRPFVDFAGTWESVPDYTAGVHTVAYPDGNFEIPKEYKVSGSCDYMEGIDPEKSFFNTIDPEWDPLINGFRGGAVMTLSAPNGDKLYLDGEILIFQTHYNEAYFNFTGGEGKFNAAEGWVKATGQANPDNGHNYMEAAGKINEPKKN